MYVAYNDSLKTLLNIAVFASIQILLAISIDVCESALSLENTSVAYRQSITDS